MSVDNFFQDEIFGDIFSNVKNSRSEKEIAPKKSLQIQATLELPPYKVIRSAKRKKSISAIRRNGIIEIHIPARTSKREEINLIPEMITLLIARESRSRRSENDLSEIAEHLLTSLLPEFEERPRSISWRRMRDRWGSCTTVDRTIRLSDRLIATPDYVLQWVLFHELVHLRHPDHGSAFYELLGRFPEANRAQAYLDGYQAGIADGPMPAPGLGQISAIDEGQPPIPLHKPA